METAVNEGERTRGLAKIRPVVLAAKIEVAVEHHRPCLPRSVEWLLSEKIKVAMEINPIACEGIIGTLHVAAVEKDASGTIEWIHVESANEPDVPRDDTVAMAICHMCLGNSRTAFVAPQFRIQRIFEVNVAEIAHGEVAYFQTVTVEIEHGEIAYGSLRLSALCGEHHVARIVSKSDEVQVLASDGEPYRFMAVLSHSYCGVIGVVYPIDVWSDIHHHWVIGSAIGELAHRLTDVAEEEWTFGDSLVIGCRIHKKMMAVERKRLLFVGKMVFSHG